MLTYYCRDFSTVEINNSFYHLPSRETLQHWTETTPSGFVFSIKASRYITHMKKLKDPEKSLVNFFERITILGDRLGPILFQLPPHWRYNQERLTNFLQHLSKDYRYTFEFRDESWLNEQCYEQLSKHKASLCIYELDGYLSPQEVTSNFVYIRLHGPGGSYQGNYSDEILRGWAQACANWSKQGYDIYCYFDNDEAGYAALNARTLHGMLR